MSGLQLPSHLLDEISRGNVIAFVGAGFCRPANLPDWKSLVLSIATEQELGSEHTELLNKLCSTGSSSDFDLAGQILADTMSEKSLNDAIRRKLTISDRSQIPAAMTQRLKWLHGTPFSAIVTTNFDNMLQGVDIQDSTALKKISHRIFREKMDEFHRLEAIAFRRNASESTVPVVKIHGDVMNPDSTLVFTRESYRKMLHSSSQYSTFIKTLMATHIVLFLGFSFTDAYLNELRSEVAAMYGVRPEAPMAYAVLSDVHPIQQKTLLHHDGLAVINYETSGGYDHSAFDTILKVLYERTNPIMKFGKLLTKRRVLWVHEDWGNSKDTRYLKEYLEKANKSASIDGLQSVEMNVASSVDQAMTILSAELYDCIISVFDTRSSIDDESIFHIDAVTRPPVTMTTTNSSSFLPPLSVYDCSIPNECTTDSNPTGADSNNNNNRSSSNKGKNDNSSNNIYSMYGEDNSSFNSSHTNTSAAKGDSNKKSHSALPRIAGEMTLQLLDSLRSLGSRGVPVLVFGYNKDIQKRTEVVLRRGGLCYTSYYYELLSQLATVLKNIKRRN